MCIILQILISISQMGRERGDNGLLAVPRAACEPVFQLPGPSLQDNYLIYYFVYQ